MKKILITGAGSYIGTKFDSWLQQWPKDYKICTVDMKDSSWRELNFSDFDVVFHVAGLVHLREKPDMESLYYKINSDLTVETAKKAKDEGVKQFIFMSTMAVYGQEGKIEDSVIINRDTKTNPKTYYAKSKLMAEQELNKLAEDKFKVVIIRAPMVYGANCPGNYAKLEKLALKSPVFPKIDNIRSVIDVNKLSEFIRNYIDHEVEGYFYPQDNEYSNTSLLVKRIAEEHGKKVYLSETAGVIIKVFGKRINLLNKVFGNLVYDIKM